MMNYLGYKNTPQIMHFIQLVTTTWEFQPSYWISIAGLYLMCDVHDDLPYSGIMPSPDTYKIHNKAAFQKIQNGSVVCLNSNAFITDFAPNYLAEYEEQNIYFSVLTFHFPNSMPSELPPFEYSVFMDSLHRNKNIVHIYFVDYDGAILKGFEDKLSGIPLGLNYHKSLYNTLDIENGLPQNIRQREMRINRKRDMLLNSKRYVLQTF